MCLAFGRLRREIYTAYILPTINTFMFRRKRDDITDRQRMVNTIAQHGISDPRVLKAMSEVPRVQFVPDKFRQHAYDDRALPFHLGQTISQPFTVAFMCQLASFRGSENVLEIGTGSGYAAAVLSRLAGRVDTIERHREFVQPARLRLKQLGYTNVNVWEGDGIVGVPHAAPFDVIIVSAAARVLPHAYQDQVANGGRIIVPLEQRCDGQIMCRFVREGVTFRREDHGRFSFVPLVGSESGESNDSK